MRSLLILLTGVCLISGAAGSSVLPLSPDEEIEAARAICRGTVVRQKAFKETGTERIYTRSIIRVTEVFKGKFPKQFALTQRGGQVDDEGEEIDLSAELVTGGEYVLFLTRTPDGALSVLRGSLGAVPTRRETSPGRAKREPGQVLGRLRKKAALAALGGEDLASEAAGDSIISSGAGAAAASLLGDGLSTGADGVPSRFLEGDRAEPIHYLVDADALPSGISLPQALTAIQHALASWTAVTSVTFVYDGLQSFGQAASDVSISDARLRIQLHDLYNVISGSTLGFGGRASLGNPSSLPVAGSGGTVAGLGFHHSVRGFVVLEHTQPSLQNALTLEEVLCHELGHALGMAHSSEDPAESNATLRESIMYYRAHGDGRGAALGSYDPPVIQQAYPQTNTPPYGFDRVMDIVTASGSQPNISGINGIELRGYDRQLPSASLTVSLAATDNLYGVYALTGTLLKYSANGFRSGARIDPADNSSYDNTYFRISDGVNRSPYYRARVISYMTDTFPGGGVDGIPDQWMIDHFGSPDPTAGPKRSAAADFDGDGLTNFQEFIYGTDPGNPASKIRILAFTPTSIQWEAMPYRVYEIERSSDLNTWPAAIMATMPLSATPTIALPADPATRAFFRVRLVP